MLLSKKKKKNAITLAKVRKAGAINHSHKTNIYSFLLIAPQMLVLRIPQIQRLLPLPSFASQMKSKVKERNGHIKFTRRVET